MREGNYDRFECVETLRDFILNEEIYTATDFGIHDTARYKHLIELGNQVETVSELDAVVVSASRTPERIMESPVTVERMDARAIQSTSSATFYDGLANLKGVDINTNNTASARHFRTDNRR